MLLPVQQMMSKTHYLDTEFWTCGNIAFQVDSY